MTEFVDSFGIYVPTSVSFSASQVSLLKRWNGIGTGSGTLGVVTAAGARGNPALIVPFGGFICKTLSHQATYTWGATINMSSVAGVGGADLVQFKNVDTTMCSLLIRADGSILVYAANNTSLVCLSTAVVIPANTNCYIEFQSTISGTSNINVAATVKVWDSSNNLLLTSTGNTNTGLSTNSLTTLTGIFGVSVTPFLAAVYNRIVLLSGGNTNGQCYFSDMYLNTSAGTTNTGFLGPVQIGPILPNGDGPTLNWTPNSGSVHYTRINELPSDEGTTYNFTSTIPATDTFDWEDIASFSGTVKTVQISYDAYSTDEGNCAIESVIGNTGSEQQSTPFPLAANYNYWHYAFDIDPATSLPWTRANFNAKRFGIRRSS